jgi:ATP adenylyltransferase
MMIVPYDHVRALSGLSEQAAAEMMRMTRLAERALEAVYHPHGLNLGMNLGAAAGAGIAEHIHMHILPRWTGDANFLSTIGETRMLPEELPTTWRKLRNEFQKLAS